MNITSLLPWPAALASSCLGTIEQTASENSKLVHNSVNKEVGPDECIDCCSCSINTLVLSSISCHTNKKLSCRWQTVLHICANAMEWLT